MNRRGFLRIIGQGLVLVPILPLTVTVAPGWKVLVQQSPVAGFQCHGGGKLFSRLREGAPLTLVREPDNKYNGDAVAVYFRDRKLGFVTRADNTAVSQMLDRVRFEVAVDG